MFGWVPRTTVASMVASEPPTNTPNSWLFETSEDRSARVERPCAAGSPCTFTPRPDFPFGPGCVSRTTVASTTASDTRTNTPNAWFCSRSEERSVNVERRCVLGSSAARTPMADTCPSSGWVPRTRVASMLNAAPFAPTPMCLVASIREPCTAALVGPRVSSAPIPMCIVSWTQARSTSTSLAPLTPIPMLEPVIAMDRTSVRLASSSRIVTAEVSAPVPTTSTRAGHLAQSRTGFD
ncbi:hypothetical protein BE20_10405 [Sorangium cellulosum]|nr:hypothetical protein BE20_10405 [Sorangium cellulosum]